MLLVFVTGIDKTNVYGGCVFVSTLIHYFTLAAVMWMGAEATLMFHKLVLVFRRVTKQGIIITSLVCWSKWTYQLLLAIIGHLTCSCFIKFCIAVAPIIPVLIPLIVDLSSGPGAENDLVVSRGEL